MREVGIKQFRANLSRWIDIVKGGEDVVITERGRPVARVIGADDQTPLERLIAQGLVRRAKGPKTPATGAPRVKLKSGTMAEFIKEQRR